MWFKNYRVNRLKIKIMRLEAQIREHEQYLNKLTHDEWLYLTTPYELSDKKVRLEVLETKLDLLTNSQGVNMFFKKFRLKRIRKKIKETELIVRILNSRLNDTARYGGFFFETVGDLLDRYLNKLNKLRKRENKLLGKKAVVIDIKDDKRS